MQTGICTALLVKRNTASTSEFFSQSGQQHSPNPVPHFRGQVTEFFACKSCDKIYWEGPRSTSYTDKFASLFEADGRIRLTSPTAI